jgi:hypothetical protein
LFSVWFYPVLYALGAVSAPIVIHLIMRTKPRKIIFPPLRFVKKTHQANISKLRLKHLILLLMRMAAVAAIVVLIAHAEVPEWSQRPNESLTASVVVIVDNSASMTYKPDGQTTLLTLARKAAQQVLDSLPKGSQAGVIATSEGASAPVRLLADPKGWSERISGIPETFDSHDVGGGLKRAVAALSDANLARDRKEVYLITDLTVRSWRDVPAVAGAGDARFFILNVAGAERVNIGLGEPALETHVPAHEKVEVRTKLISTRLGGQMTVQLRLDGNTVDTQTVLVEKDATAAVTLRCEPDPAEPIHHGSVRLASPAQDPLEMDNERFFTVRVGAAIKGLVVREPPTAGREDPTHLLMASALLGEERWMKTETITVDRLDASRLADARVVILEDASSVTVPQWQAMEKFVREGGTLWIVSGSLMSVSVDSYNSPAAQALMPVTLTSLEELPKEVGWRIMDAGDPMIEPFVSGRNAPLTQVQCRRRFAVRSVAPEARAIVQYADLGGPPAIVVRPVGQGQVLFWNFSPAPAFSNLAPLVQFPILAQQVVRLYAAESTINMMQTWGRKVVIPLPKGYGRSGAATVRKPFQLQDEPCPPPDAGNKTLTLLADRLGPWTIRLAGGDPHGLEGFSVNVDLAESDLTPVAPKDVEAKFPAKHVMIGGKLSDFAQGQQTVSVSLDLTTPLVLALLLLLTVESFFANRFYKQGGTALTGATGRRG